MFIKIAFLLIGSTLTACYCALLVATNGNHLLQGIVFGCFPMLAFVIYSMASMTRKTS